MQMIQANELRDLVRQDNLSEAVIIDVRTPSEYRSEHIDGASNVPLSEIDRHVENLRRYKHVYVHCASGNRSIQACEKLNSLGLDNLVNVAGGINAWKDAGFPIYKDKSAPLPIMQQVQVAAGSLVLVGVLMSLIVNPLWVLLSGFVGAGLTFAGFSGTCTMGLILARMPWNRR
jgi:rhodanese-related sulfurtransferase